MLQTQAHMQMKMQNTIEEQMIYDIQAHLRICSLSEYFWDEQKKKLTIFMNSVRNKVQSGVNQYLSTFIRRNSVHRVIPENSSSQAINAFLRKPQVIQESPPLHSNLDKNNPDTDQHATFLKFQHNITFGTKERSFPSRLSDKNFVC
jgi:uncharacterized protein (DUF885 family)